MKITTSLFVAFIIQIIINNATAQVEPYLSSPTSSSIWVSWKTVSETESKVEFGLTPDNLNNIATGTYIGLADNYKWHTVKLTGLTPDTRYFYRTISDGQTSKTQRFRSQPPEDSRSGHYRFAIIGDHQIISDDRYQRLVQACKDKVIEKYATSVSDTLIEDHLRLLICDGDQVTIGSLEHYEKMHFGQSRPLMSNVPIMTVVGNHEYNSDPNLVKYFGHYVYDDISYKGITGSNGEEYYTFKVANILFVMINSKRGNDPSQLSWIEQIVAAVDADDSVGWLFAVNHHCFYNEQMPSDGIASVRDEYAPRLTESPKYVMHITGHAHLYARGSLRNHPCHVIINGGASGDQYWGEVPYIDYQDVQKTIERQIFQIVDIDLGKREMHVETYSNGTNLPPGFTENALIDEYYMKLDAPQPDKPFFKNKIPEKITLPFTFEGSEYSGQEPFNSIECQVAGDFPDFGYPEYSFKKDYEDIFLSTGSPDYVPIDQNKGIDITQMTLDSINILAGEKYLRFRYRDQSLHWSPWSDTVSFTVLGNESDSFMNQYQCPVLRYKLNENANETVNRRLNGTSTTGVNFIPDSVEGGVAEFNNNGMIIISEGSTTGLRLPSKSISVSCWVRLNTWDYWGGFVGIFQDNGSYEKGWVLGTFNNKFSFAVSTVSSLNYLTADDSIKPGEWYHITGTFNGSRQMIYINGELKGLALLSGEIEYPPTGWFQIGAYKDDNEFFGHDGNISDVIIWERAISLNDVKNIYEKTVPPCADFEASKTEIKIGGIVQFDDLTQFEPQSWQWYFEGGDPEISNEQYPTVVYNHSGIYDVQLLTGNINGSDSLVKEMYIQVGPVGIDETELSHNVFKIYPNPVNDKLNIQILDDGYRGSQVIILNSSGKLIYSYTMPLDLSYQKIDLKNFPPGIYFIRLLNSHQIPVIRNFVVE